MKLNRLLTASVLGFSMLTTSAFACDHDSHSWSFFGWCSHTDKDNDKKRECDQNGQNSGTGNNCDHGRGNGGGYCGTGGSSTGSGGSSTGTGSTGGSTTVGPKG